MRRFPCPFRALLTVAAALAVTAGAGLGVWGAVDRATAERSISPVAPWGETAPPDRIGRAALAAEASAHPTSAVYARLALAEAAAGRPTEAASAALTASRLSPANAAMASAAEGYVDSAFRAHVRRVVRPFAVIGAALLALSFVGVARRRRDERRREAVLTAARGRLVLSVEGDGEARADSATLRSPGARGLVIDVHTDAALASLKTPPPLVVALTHGGAGRTVRLAPKKDAAGGAARFRVTGDALREVLSHPGAWRILVRADGALLAQGTVRVEPAWHRNGHAA